MPAGLVGGYQGKQEITAFIEDNGNSKLKSLYGDFDIQTITENNKVYCEPEPLMSMLFADCTYYDNTLLIDLPQYTVYEATNFDYSKYQSDVLSYGIDENNDNMGTALIKFGLVVQRTAISFSSDIFVDSNYGFYATENTLRQYYYEAFNEVLGYDINVTEEETKVYEKINDLGSFLVKTQDGDISDTPFTDFYISSYIGSYAKKGIKDNNSLSVFNDTIRDLSTNGRVNEKLNSYLNQSGKDVLTNILFNSALEYVRRSSYDRKVLDMFKTFYSEDMVNKYNISLSENSQFIFQCARDYYNSCGSFDEIVKEVTLNESINKFSEMITKGLFSVATAGKSQEVFETYETILTAEKLQEANSSFKPVEKINNSAKYFWLAKMQYTTVLTLDEISKKSEESLNSEDMANFVSNLDFYNRVSSVMIKTLADSYQLPTTTKREKDLIANSDTYISDLCRNIYKLECCEYNLPTKEELNNKNCDVFKNFFSNQENDPTANYTWHLAPTIEAEDIIVPDNKDTFLETGYVSPYDECALIKQDGKYGIIKYDGTNIAESLYEFGGYDIQGAIGVYNEYDQIKGEERVDVFSDRRDLRIEINQERGWGYVGSTYYWDNNKQQVYQFEGSPVYGEHTDNLSFNVVVQSADIEQDGKCSNISEKYGIANQNKLLVPIEYDKGYMHSFNNVIALEEGNKWTYFDKDGKVIIQNCDGFTSNNRVIDWWAGGDWYNYNNNYILPYIPTENYIPVKINGKCGYYDIQGNEVIPCGTFEEVRPVHNELAWVKKDGKWGVIKLVEITEPATTTTESTPTIPEEASTYNGHSYMVYSESMTWKEAKEYCENLGGHLVTISDADEQKFVEDLTEKYTDKVSYWLGGYYSDAEWKWVDDTEFSYTNWDSWTNGEKEYRQPDNFTSDEFYLRFANRKMQYENWYSNKGKWNDIANEADGSSGDVPLNSFGVICEWDSVIQAYKTEDNTIEAKPEDTIRKMERALNNLDMEELIECYEPQVQKMYNEIFKCDENLMGMDINSLFGGSINIYENEFGLEMPEITINIDSQEYINSDQVKMRLTIHYQNSTISDEAIDISLIQINDIWYISSEMSLW